MMKGIVNREQRYAKMRAHTATHLLHAALGEFVQNIKQAGSLVEEDYVRFDFTADDLLTQAELFAITQRVNKRIAQSYDVKTTIKSYNEAVSTGAKAFFEDKYGDEVRVVAISSENGEGVSVELCGGTHVSNTADIGAFIVVEHGSVASGVKRIVAYTGVKVAEYASSLEKRLATIAQEIKVQPSQVEQKIEKIMKEQQQMIDVIQRLEEQQIISTIQSLGSGDENFDIIVYVDKYDTLKNLDFKTVVQKVKDYFVDTNVAVYGSAGNFALLGQGAKSFAAAKGLQGGGSDSFVQGRDMKVVSVFQA